MPKEIVADPLQFSAEHPDESCVVEVSWGREVEHVQIATTLVHSADHTKVTRDVEGGWYANLDRKSINDLIRHLRRARDQAFGRDE